ncbi:hypothetical protein DN545_32840, partial [Burkholderia multivorans]
DGTAREPHVLGVEVVLVDAAEVVAAAQVVFDAAEVGADVDAGAKEFAIVQAAFLTDLVEFVAHRPEELALLGGDGLEGFGGLLGRALGGGADVAGGRS